MISINDLQQSQEPDLQGRRLPRDATLGGAGVWSPTISDGLVVNAMLMNPVTKTCGSCGGLPYVISNTMSDKAAYTGSPLYSGCDPHPVNPGVTMYFNVLYSDYSQSSGGCANSSSSDTSVATVSGCYVSPVAPGTTNITARSSGAYFTDPACSQQGIWGQRQ